MCVRRRRPPSSGPSRQGSEKAEGKKRGTESKIQNPKSARWLMLVKNNLAEEGAVPGLAFELIDGRIRWEKTTAIQNRKSKIQNRPPFARQAEAGYNTGSFMDC
jgi:hypothetical protein